jgi:crotonobetainyl-CoA:carnitine CoA-transferase CaiB-like acyl-CoA transferase
MALGKVVKITSKGDRVSNGALAGVMVLEFGHLISASYCCKLMADLGAEVIKVELPSSGDEARRYGPFPRDIPHPEKSGLFLYLNTNKRGITLNPQQATGVKLFLGLVERIDVLVENWPPNFMATLGLAYEKLTEINPRLIMTSITPFGQAGPYSKWKAYALNVSHGAGVAKGIGSPGREPLAPPGQQAHFFGGLNAAAATMVALWERENSGEGQLLDISEADCWAMLFNGAWYSKYLYGHEEVTRLGHRSNLPVYPWGVLRCKDGFISATALEEAQWQRLVELMGNPEWAQDPRFEKGVKRSRHADELDERLESWFASRTKAEIFQACREKNVPFSPVQDIREVVECPHLEERSYFVKMQHPEAGETACPGPPYKLSETPWEIRRRAPLLGEHNEEIYCGLLGYAPHDVVTWREEGVL